MKYAEKGKVFLPLHRYYEGYPMRKNSSAFQEHQDFGRDKPYPDQGHATDYETILLQDFWFNGGGPN